MTLEEYIKDVKGQLVCNSSSDYQSSHTTYNYSDREVDSNLDYFTKCWKLKVSSYKALLLFDDYLNGWIEM